ncbi:MAG TPA: serine hydrolase domain-containing protein [Gemmatimonadaceae bacterium]|nr:serine hydrolase domain-containing protein [Gemmatimonadaceae bacterium]
MASSEQVVGDTIPGSVASGYEAVQAVFRGFFDRKWDVGSGVAVYVGGEPIVRLTGGSRVVASGDAPAYDASTIQLVASTTKFVESVCVMLLVDRGLVRYGDRIVDHWPEFANGNPGKERVTIRQLMMHRAGLPVFERKLGDDELFDLGARARFLERQPQVDALFQAERGDWRTQTPAPPQAYHAVSRGLYSSELVRRVDAQHRRLGAFFRGEIAEPLGIDFWIGLPDELAPRVSGTHMDPTVIMRLMSGDTASLTASTDPRHQLTDYEISFLLNLLRDPDSLQSRALNCLAPSGVAPTELANHPKLRACELASSSGFGSADALARIAAVAMSGTLGGTRIFSSDASLRQATGTAHTYATDSMMLTRVEFTQGGFASFLADDSHGTVSIGWGGAGGQLVRFVPELDLAIAYVTNTLGSRMAMNDPRGLELLDVAIRCARR